MNKIEAIIQPSRLDAVGEALIAIGVPGLTVSRVDGFGWQRGRTAVSQPDPSPYRLLAKIKVEVVVPGQLTEAVIATLVQAAFSGNIGDGKIFVLPVSDVVRIRTGERGEQALTCAQFAAEWSPFYLGAAYVSQNSGSPGSITPK